MDASGAPTPDAVIADTSAEREAGSSGESATEATSAEPTDGAVPAVSGAVDRASGMWGIVNGVFALVLFA